MRISVCMATFNGELFICNQIKSILMQLDKNDELIIIDDASSDKTVQLIKNFNDSRIKLNVNVQNIGVVSTFEEALRKVNGDIICLSDQDDIWMDGKLSFIRKFFRKNNIDLIVHDAEVLINNKLDEKSLFEIINSSRGFLRNLYSNTFTGCCMAFRCDLLKMALPIPKSKGVYHDAWIGLISEIYWKKISFISIPFVQYNRHENNLSSMSTRSLFKIIPERISLIVHLSFRVISNLFKKLGD